MFIPQKYTTIFRLSFIQTIKNYKNLIGLSIFLITCLIIFAYIWKLATSKQGSDYLNPVQLLWYIAFNEWILVAVPDIQDEMEYDLKTGRLSYLLIRPISYLLATFSGALGTLFANLLVLGIVTFSFTWWQTETLSFHFTALPTMLVIGILAGVVAIIFHMLVGLSSFWLQDITPFYWIWEKLLFVFGGLMLPLTVYPEWMQKIAQYTPFPAILGGRSALAIDFALDKVVFLLFTLICWGMIGTFLLLIFYRRGLKILNIEGG